MDITPATVLGRVRLAIQIILLKSRPYLENNFETPITKTTMDEVQRSTVASALQRIHNSAPHSQHNEALQWSVWQIAGSGIPRTPPLFSLPTWILGRGDDDGYFSHLPPAMLVTLLATSMRGHAKWQMGDLTIVRDLLRRMEKSNVPWAQLVVAVSDYFGDRKSVV